MPWIHHRLHPLMVRIFLRLGLSKRWKKKEYFLRVNVLTTWSSLLEAWLLVRSAQQKETVLQLRFPHLVIWRPVTWISSPDGPSRTLLSDHKCRSRLCSAEYFGGTRQARQSNQRTAASSVWTCQSDVCCLSLLSKEDKLQAFTSTWALNFGTRFLTEKAERWFECRFLWRENIRFWSLTALRFGSTKYFITGFGRKNGSETENSYSWVPSFWTVLPLAERMYGWSGYLQLPQNFVWANLFRK